MTFLEDVLAVPSDNDLIAQDLAALISRHSSAGVHPAEIEHVIAYVMPALINNELTNW